MNLIKLRLCVVYHEMSLKFVQAKIRRIKNYEDMKKEDLIISLLKSKQSIAEIYNNNLYDSKISDIRRILSRLRDILPKKDRKEIKDKLYEIEHQRNISEEEKEKNDEYLRKLIRFLNNKEKCGPGNRDDFDYNGKQIYQFHLVRLVKKIITNKYL